jgi:hypothetical protein
VAVVVAADGFLGVGKHERSVDRRLSQRIPNQSVAGVGAVGSGAFHYTSDAARFRKGPHDLRGADAATAVTAATMATITTAVFVVAPFIVPYIIVSVDSAAQLS